MPEEPIVPPATPAPVKPKLMERIMAAIKRHPRRAWAIGIVSGLALTAGAVIGLTDLKYTVVGLILKSSYTTTVVDQETNEPLAGVNMSVGEISAQTDSKGQVTLKGIHPGWQQITLEKKAYRPQILKLKLNFGQNWSSKDTMELDGIRLKFAVANFVTGQALAGARIAAGEVEGMTDTQGKGTASVEDNGAKQVDVEISLAGFVSKTVTVKPQRGAPATAVKLVPEGKVYYLTNRNRRIDLMRSNLDGSNEELILPGTGNEDSETGILPSIVNPGQIALVSSRDGKHDQYGNLQHDLFILNGDTKQLDKLDEDVDFANPRSWVGNYLVYELNRTNSQSLKSYEAITHRKIELAAVVGQNSYTSLTLGYGTNSVYYSVEDAADDAKSGLFKVSPAGQERKRLSDTPANEVIRQAKTSLTYRYYDYDAAGGSIWRFLNLTNDKVTSLEHGPSDENSRGYADSPGKKYSAFVEERDGRSELYLADYTGTNEKRVTTGAKVGQFVQWYDDSYIVFSVTDGESSLYVVSISGGKPVKIADFYRGNGRTYSGGYNPVY